MLHARPWPWTNKSFIASEIVFTFRLRNNKCLLYTCIHKFNVKKYIDTQSPKMQLTAQIHTPCGPPPLPFLPNRRQIRLIESNAKCCYLKKFTCKGTLRQVFICLRPPPLLDFCLGWCCNFVGSESGQKQSVKLLQNMLSNTTQHTPIPFQPHTVCIYCTLTMGRGEGRGRWTREKVKEAIVHKAGSKILTWLTVSPVYKLFWTPVKTPFSFGVFIVN